MVALIGLVSQIALSKRSAGAIPVSGSKEDSDWLNSSRPIVACLRSINESEAHSPSQPRLRLTDRMYFWAPGYGGDVIMRSMLSPGSLEILARVPFGVVRSCLASEQYTAV